jgi:heme oxygenase
VASKVRPIEQLRESTRQQHAELDEGAYARAVLDGSLSIAEYASFLRALLVVHEGLGRTLASDPDESMRALAGLLPERCRRLEQDLAQWDESPARVDAGSLQAALLAQEQRRARERDPMELYGHLYVLEGSQLGGLAQHAALSQRPEFADGRGLSYLAGEGKATRATFHTFVVRLEAALEGDPQRVTAAVRGAQTAFAGFAAVLRAIRPEPPDDFDKLRAPLALQLNGEAGHHPIPGDLREIEAALRAGERSYDAFPYYVARYGERGLRFTRSDSAWLACLAREHPESLGQQAAWLGRVLAGRGMPSWLLEQHLALLAKELAERVPERAADYAVLSETSASMRSQRVSRLSDERMLELERRFDDWVGSEQASKCPRTGALLAAAVADARAGIDTALPALTHWLRSPQRFTPEWIAAVDKLVAEAQAES